jgi:16S rRNA (adenine(1408)-N(1))-methyltransferase
LKVEQTASFDVAPHLAREVTGETPVPPGDHTCLRQFVVVPSDNSTKASFDNLSNLTGGVIVDIGTGDGRFVYQTARENPAKFYVGIDANSRPLEKISMKATRRPAKGGAPNLMFVQAAIEDLPDELNDAADEIHIHFPWGSLLRAVATGEAGGD